MPRCRGRTGFTLVEVVIASALMALVFVVLLNVSSYGRKSAAVSGNRLANLQLARQVLETVSSRAYSSVTNAANIGGLPTGVSGRCDVTTLGGGTVKNVTVSLRWREAWGLTNTVSLTTSICRALNGG